MKHLNNVCKQFQGSFHGWRLRNDIIILCAPLQYGGTVGEHFNWCQAAESSSRCKGLLSAVKAPWSHVYTLSSIQPGLVPV